MAASRAKSLALVGAARRRGRSRGACPRARSRCRTTVKATAWRLADRLAERLALVDVGDHVVEHRLRGADRQRAPGEPAEPHALGVGVGAPSPSSAPAGTRDAVEQQPRRSRRRAGPSPARPRPRAPSVAGLDDEQRRPVALGRGGDDEQLGVGGARHERLERRRGPSRRRLRARRGLELERVEERPRLEHRQRGGGDVLAGERRQVGRLLVGVAPEAERGGDGGRREGGDGEAHVAVGERLGDQHGGDGRALLDHAAELLGHAEHRRRRARSPARAAPRGRRSRRRPPGRPVAAAPRRSRRTPPGSSAARRRRRGRRGRPLALLLASRVRRASGRRRSAGRPRWRRGSRCGCRDGRGARPGSRRPTRSSSSEPARRLRARSPTLVPWSARFMAAARAGRPVGQR